MSNDYEIMTIGSVNSLKLIECALRHLIESYKKFYEILPVKNEKILADLKEAEELHAAFVSKINRIEQNIRF
jgi:hypothetical protein